MHSSMFREEEEKRRKQESKEDLARKIAQDAAHKQEVHQQRLHLEADRAGLR